MHFGLVVTGFGNFWQTKSLVWGSMATNGLEMTMVCGRTMFVGLRDGTHAAWGQNVLRNLGPIVLPVGLLEPTNHQI